MVQGTMEGEQGSTRYLWVILAVCILALLVVGLIFAGLMAGSKAASSAESSDDISLTIDVSSQQVATSADVEELTQTVSSKLADAQETVDESGIVHGTAANGVSYLLWGRGVAGASADKVTLTAVGDLIGTDNSNPLAAAYGAESGQSYDFRPFFQEVAQYIQQGDLRYINQETVMAECANVQGWPTFNSPDACAQAISDVGFNLVNFCSNHTYDFGTQGVEESLAVFDAYPQLVVAGSYESAADRDTLRLIERNGMVFAFLAYTCCDNMYATEDNAPNSYNLCYANKETMEAEIRRAQSVADAVIVSMHWGDEYTYDLNADQLEYSQFLADLDVDLVLGSHGHNVQPTQYVTGASGHVTPVVFGLSDFVSGWTLVDTIFSGIFSCDFVRTAEGVVEVQNCTWYPCIEWSDGGDVYVRRLCDMSADEVDANTRITDIGQSYYDYLVSAISNCGMEVPVIL